MNADLAAALAPLVDYIAERVAERLSKTTAGTIVTDLDAPSFGATPRALRETVRRGELRGTKKGRRMVFARADVEAWALGRAEKKRPGGKAAPPDKVDELARRLGLQALAGGAQ